MILADKPYISEFLKETARKFNLPVIETESAKSLGLTGEPFLIKEADAVGRIKEKFPLIYTTSENAIGWISKNLSFTSLPEKVELFKNKVKFRQMIKELYPDFYYEEVSYLKLKELDADNLKLPFIIKPCVGFFSIGVHKVARASQLKSVIKLIEKEIFSASPADYPKEVVDTTNFIIEECIEGNEYAVDAHYNNEGKPVILNIHLHYFSSEDDVSDRVYVTSKDIIEENLVKFTSFLEELGRLSNVKNFPVHVELRKRDDGSVCPIEVNPLRFGGWCTTADATFYAYGFNPYLYYFNQKEPDWKSILKEKDGKTFGLVVLDNSTGIEADDINGFDYEKLLKYFSSPIELRKIDYAQYPVFGFLFTEVNEDKFNELEYILSSDLREFIF